MSRKEYHHYYHGKNDSGEDNNNNNGLGILALVFLFVVGLIFSIIIWLWNLAIAYWYIAIPVVLFILYCVGKYSDTSDK